MSTAIGVDIGGTKIFAALVNQTDGLLVRRTSPTPTESERAVAAIIETIRSIWPASGEPPSAIGIGAAGLVDIHAGIVRYAPNLSYREVPLRTLIESEFGVPVTLDNDATCAAYAEYRTGAGRGSRFMVMVTVGTGIGGGFIFNGAVFHGMHGFAAEIGHMVIDPSGPMCGCGQRGCWERLASGTALGEFGRAAAAAPGGEAILAAARGDIEAVRGEDVTEAADGGDPVALGILAQMGTNLGIGLANLANILDPDRFVIGGGLSRVETNFLVHAERALAERMEGAAHRPPVEVTHALLGNDAGAVGAAMMALNQLVTV